jgi:hypothetical protein
MTNWERLQALPQPQRSVAQRLLLGKIFKRFSEMTHVSEENMKYYYGFNRSDLLRWYAAAKERAREKQGLVS